nr:GH3 auxin-responsive promoter family protein [Myxococcaceae bacterium]
AVSDARARALAAEVESSLQREHHYRYCRDLGQLGAVEVVRVTSGRAKWLAALQARGLKLGDIKPQAFDGASDWARWLLDSAP